MQQMLAWAGRVAEADWQEIQCYAVLASQYLLLAEPRMRNCCMGGTGTVFEQ